MSKLKQLLFSLNETDRKVIEEKLKTQDQQINQLKQQNEELMLQLNRQNVEEHKPVYCTLAGTECEYLGKVEELKQQLAEKDKEIERLKNLFKLNNEVVINQGKEIFNLRVQVLQQKQNQTQLAIQELEKVKASADKWFESWENSKYEGNIYDKLDVSNAYLQMSCEIDQQIKELKGEKDVED